MDGHPDNAPGAGDSGGTRAASSTNEDDTRTMQKSRASATSTSRTAMEVSTGGPNAKLVSIPPALRLGG